MLGVNWKPWLPPKGLPNTGHKTYKAGQVIAWRMNDDTLGEVLILREPNRGEVLATTTKGSSGPFTTTGVLGWLQSVLVADVDCEPIDPDLLYQFLLLKDS